MFGTYQRLGVSLGASPRQVIRAARAKLTPLGKSRAQREARRAFLAQMLAYHAEARALARAYRL